MFTAELFIISKTWKQPECPLTDESVKKILFMYIYVCIYTVEYYSAIIKNEIKPLVATWADPEIMLSEVSQKKINI